jgi:hypothetical protein
VHTTRAKTEDSRVNNVADEGRSRTHGREISAFRTSPVAPDGTISCTAMPGIAYDVAARAEAPGESALLTFNGLGPSGETWSLNSSGFPRGRLSHRSPKELVVIGAGDPECT